MQCLAARSIHHPSFHPYDLQPVVGPTTNLLDNPSKRRRSLWMAPFTKPKLVSFTCEDATLDLTRRRDHKSRETSGVWVKGDWAWKIFPNMDQWNRVRDDYDAARTHHLPIPLYKLYSGTITDSRGLRKEGFALVAIYITRPARFFALKSGTKAVKSMIAPITDDAILSKMEQAFFAAWKMGLRDPQGFINQHNPEQPIVFIDLHTSSTPAPSTEDLYKYVRGRRATLL